jgi:hypothetical protein
MPQPYIPLTTLQRMALPERKQVEGELVDPTAVERAYRRQRLRRRAREERARERQLAAVRFWLAVLTVIGTSIGLAIVIWQQIHRLFGL